MTKKLTFWEGLKEIDKTISSMKLSGKIAFYATTLGYVIAILAINDILDHFLF